MKFHDHLRVRVRDGSLTSQVQADLHSANEVRQRLGLSFRGHTLDVEQQLEFIESRAEQVSGNAQADLAGDVFVDGADETLEATANELLTLEEIEYVQFVSRVPQPQQVCSDISPPTPNYFAQGLQGYHGPDPGVNMACAWGFGGRGAGIRIATFDNDYLPSHEDLCTVNGDPPVCGIPDGYGAEHGNAVLGILGALENGYGGTGLAPEAEIWFFTAATAETCRETQESVQAATAAAIASLRPGDVFVTTYATYSGPLETDRVYFDKIKAATDTGIIVVEVSNNLNLDLDAPSLSYWHSWGDSGAIIVGGGSSDLLHNRLWFSSFGSRVNVQAWGENVFTLACLFRGRDPDGCLDLAPEDFDARQTYDPKFDGTSAAAPIVAGAAAALQSLRLQAGLPLYTSQQMRQLLVQTGIPQGDPQNGHIGPAIDLSRAIVPLGIGASDCNYNGVADECEPPGSVPPTPVSGGQSKNRAISFSVPPEGGGPGESMAIRVAPLDLQNPIPPNTGQSPPNFSQYEWYSCTAPGETNQCARWVGPPRTYLQSNLVPQRGSFRAAQLQCTPYYHTWGSEGQLHVFGAEIIPSSTYEVQALAAICQGIESWCPDVSCPVTMTTARWGDVAAPFQDPALPRSQPNALDIVATIDKFRSRPGSASKPVALLRENACSPVNDVNSVDVGWVISAFKGFAYPFIGPCPCASPVSCGGRACRGTVQCAVCVGGSNDGKLCGASGVDCDTGTCGPIVRGGFGVCVHTCSTGPNAGQECIGNLQCGKCNAGTFAALDAYCDSDLDCGTGGDCNTTGRKCTAGTLSLVGFPCATNGDCKTGGACQIGVCSTEGYCRDRCGRCSP